MVIVKIIKTHYPLVVGCRLFSHLHIPSFPPPSVTFAYLVAYLIIQQGTLGSFLSLHIHYRFSPLDGFTGN